MDAESFAQMIAAVREFVRTEVVPSEATIEETDAIPDVIRRRAVEMGLFGYALPAEYGGLGLSLAEDVRLAFEFGYTAPAFRSMFGTNNGIAGQVIAKYGTVEQKQAFLPRLAAGDVASFALTEAEAGSDPSTLRTTARPDGDDWIIGGQKRFITNAGLSDLLIVFARTDPDQPGGAGISSFVVDTRSPGITVGPKDKKMGQAGAWSSEVFFDDVRVPGDRLIGGTPHRGFATAMSVLARGRVHIAALCVGLAERILEESTAFAATNRQGGRPIGEYQLVQAMLAESYTELRAGRALVLDTAARYDDGTDVVMGPSAAKLYCSEMVGRVADRGVQIHGGSGYMRATPVERFYRDARLYRIYEGTSEIQKLIIGRSLVTQAQRPGR
jgi:acyl-CoA dehydrogenase